MILPSGDNDPGEGRAPGIQWVASGEAVKLPPQKNYAVPNANSVEVEKLSYLEDTPHPPARTRASGFRPEHLETPPGHSCIFAQGPGQHSPGGEQVFGEFLPLCVAPGYINSHLNSCSRSQFRGGERERHNFPIKGHGLRFSPLRAVRIWAPLK